MADIARNAAKAPATRGVAARIRGTDGRSIRYLAVGAWNTLFGYLLFVALHQLLGRRASYLVVLTITQVIATLNAFILYRRFVFRVHGNVVRDLLRFSTVYVGTYAVNLVALPLLVEVFSVPVLLAQAMIVTVTVTMSYIAHREFSFRRPKGGASR